MCIIVTIKLLSKHNLGFQYIFFTVFSILLALLVGVCYFFDILLFILQNSIFFFILFAVELHTCPVCYFIAFDVMDLIG